MIRDRLHCPKSKQGHHKVYANFVYTSYPEQRPWICGLCGYRGVDCGDYAGSNEEYNKLLNEFIGEDDY